MNLVVTARSPSSLTRYVSRPKVRVTILGTYLGVSFWDNRHAALELSRLLLLEKMLLTLFDTRIHSSSAVVQLCGICEACCGAFSSRARADPACPDVRAHSGRTCSPLEIGVEL